MENIINYFCFSWFLNFLNWLGYWWSQYQLYRNRDRLAADHMPVCAAELQQAQCASPQVQFGYICGTFGTGGGEKEKCINYIYIFI